MPLFRPPGSPSAAPTAVPRERTGAGLPGADRRGGAAVVAAVSPLRRRLSLVSRPAGQRPHPERVARACGGAAHGADWAVGVDGPPLCVELSVGPSTHPYRLLRTPVTGRPARDALGTFLYVPVVGSAEPDDPRGGQVLPFPVGGRDGSGRGRDGNAVPPR